MLSKKAKQAIKTLILLGKQADGTLLSGSQIAEMENIPKKSMEAVLNDLKNAGFVFGKKGINGGYLLIQPLDKIMMVDVVRYMDGAIAQVACASVYHYRRCEECVSEETCSIRDLYLEIRAADLQILSGRSVADMIAKETALANDLIIV